MLLKSGIQNWKLTLIQYSTWFLNSTQSKTLGKKTFTFHLVVPLASSTRPLTTAAGFWHMMGTHEGGGPVQYPDLSIYYFSIYICPTSFNTLASVIARENISFITEHNHGLSIPKCVHLTHSVDSSICRWLGTTAVHCWKKLKLDIFNGQFCLAHRHSWEGDG